MLYKIKRKVFLRFNLYHILTLVFFSLLFGGLFLGHVIWAVDVQYQVPFGGISSGDLLPEYINKVYKWLIGGGLVLVGIMITIGGFMYLSSGSNTQSVATGKKYIINSLVGMLLLVSAYVILNTISPHATNLEVIDVSGIEQKKMSGGICACDKNSDCPQPNTYCMSSSDTTPFNPKVSSDVAEALSSVFNVFMSVATLPMGVGTTIGPKIVAQGGVKMAAKNAATRFATAAAKKTVDLVTRATVKVKDKFVWAFKNPGKFTGKVITKTVKTGAKVWAAKRIVFIVGLILIANMGFTFEFGASCPNPNGQSLCISDLFKYNLIPHGMGPSDEPGIGIQVNIDDGTMEPTDPPRTFLYNSDGSLPIRNQMLGDVSGTYAVHYFVPPLGNIEPAYLYLSDKVFPGLTNRDACMPSNNHCPCIEWEIWDTENGNYKCKRQARCVAGNVIHPRLDDDYSFCLTGSQGEPCKDDNDCRVGSQCVVIKDYLVAKGISLFFKGIAGATRDVTGLAKDLKSNTGGIYELKPPYAFQQVCMPTSGGSASRVIDSECTIADNNAYCKPGTGIKGRDVSCSPMKAAAVSEQNTSYTSPCRPLYYICYKEVDGRPKYDISALETRKRTLRFSYTYQAKSNEECYTHYSQITGLSDAIFDLVRGGFENKNAVVFFDEAEDSFMQKKYENILGFINEWNLTNEEKSRVVEWYTNDQKTKDILKLMIEKDLQKKEQYVLQANGQCYVRLPVAGYLELSTDETLINYNNLQSEKMSLAYRTYVNLSLLKGEIGTWFDQRVVDQNLKCDVDYQATKDLIWLQVLQTIPQ